MTGIKIGLAFITGAMVLLGQNFGISEASEPVAKASLSSDLWEIPKTNLKRHVYTDRERELALGFSMKTFKGMQKYQKLNYSNLVELAQKRPENQRAPEDYLILAAVERQEKNFEKAGILSKQGLHLNAGLFEVNVALQTVHALSLRDLGKVKRYEEALLELLSAQPDSATEIIIDFLRELNEHEEAERVFSILFARYGSRDWLHGHRGWFYYRIKQLDRAESDLSQVVRLNPGQSHPYKNLARVHVEQKEYDEAEDVLKQALINVPDDMEVHLYFAEVARKQHDAKKEEVHLKHMVRMDSNASEGLLELAQFYQRQRNYQEAEEVVKRVLGANPDSPQAHMLLGDVYRKQKLYKKAEVEYIRVQQIEPFNSEASARLGNMDFDLGNVEKISEHRKVFQNNPDSIKARIDLVTHLGVMHGTTKVEKEEAERLIKEGIKKHPDSWEAYVSYGKLLYGQQRHAEAEKLFKKALKLNPGAADVYQWLAAVYSGQRKHRQAFIMYEEANKSFPDNPALGRSLKWYRENMQTLKKVWELEAQVKGQRNNADLRLDLGNLYGKIHHTKKARYWYEEAIRMEPDNAEAYLHLGRTFSSESYWDEAAEKFKQALAINPRMVPALVHLASYYSAIKRNPKQADVICKKLADENLKEMGDLGALVRACEISKNYGLAEEGLRKQIPLMEKDERYKVAMPYKYTQLEKLKRLKINQQLRNRYSFVPVALHNFLQIPRDPSWSPLHIAAASGDVKKVQAILNSKVDIEVRNREGSTPLYVAAKRGHLNVVKLLAEKGADVNALGGVVGFTPLHQAAGFYHKEVVRYLLDHGAKVDSKNNLGQTPLTQVALQEWHPDVEIARMLLDHKANIHYREGTGCPPVLCAAAVGNRNLVALLLDRGANVNDKNSYGLSPLYIAVAERHPAVVRLLIRKGADPKMTYRGMVPLQKAFQTNQLELSEILGMSRRVEN